MDAKANELLRERAADGEGGIEGGFPVRSSGVFPTL